MRNALVAVALVVVAATGLPAQTSNTGQLGTIDFPSSAAPAAIIADPGAIGMILAHP